MPASLENFSKKSCCTLARIAPEVLRRLPGDEDGYETRAIDVSKRVFREFFSVLGAAYSVTQER